MQQGQVRFAFRIVINQYSSTAWEKYLWESTYQEFLMQAQLFNDKAQPVLTFKELLSKNEKAEQLHFLVSTAAHPYILQWKGKIYHLADTLGNNFMPFNYCQLDIIDSNIKDIKAHEIGLTFYTPVLSLIDIWEGHYLISLDENLQNLSEGLETLMYKMQNRLSVAYFKAIV
jgi:hypothetical protein